MGILINNKKGGFMEKKIFKYIALEQEFYKGKYRYTKVVGGSQIREDVLPTSGLPLIPNVNKLKINDTFIEEVA